MDDLRVCLCASFEDPLPVVVVQVYDEAWNLKQADRRLSKDRTYLNSSLQVPGNYIVILGFSATKSNIFP